MEEKQEMWKPIPGWTSYEVSDHGQVRNIYTGKTIKQFQSQSGSFAVTLSKHGNTQTMYVARLMMQAFHPVADFSSRQVRYKDGDRFNLSLDNLEWKAKRKNRVYSDANIRDLQDRINSVIEEWHQEILELAEKDKQAAERPIIKW